MPSDKIRVPEAVYRALEAMRESGKVDMFDQPSVIQLAREMGFEETALYIETHKQEYAAGVLVRGFEPDADPPE